MRIQSVAGKSRLGGLKARGKMRYLQRNQRIVAAIKGGKSVDWVASAYGLGSPMIRVILRQMGCSYPKRGTGPEFPCGHERSSENTRRQSNGSLRCLTCHREKNRLWHTGGYGRPAIETTWRGTA